MTIGESPALRRALIGGTLAVIGVLLILPLVTVFAQALENGPARFIEALTEPDCLSALRLTLTVAAIAVPLNTIFGLAAGWSIAKFRFPGRRVLITLIEVPFSVSPVISGMVFVLIFGLNGWLGPFLRAHGVQVLFALPGLVLATMFVTVPFVARQIIPLMEAQGTAEEEAALTLGAGGWRIFSRVTLPNIRWALLYGVLLCNARSMGEFGAVSVVSGHIRGLTNTMPLQVEILYNEYNLPAAFAVASLLALLALVTLAVKSWVEWRDRRAGELGVAAVLKARRP